MSSDSSAGGKRPIGKLDKAIADHVLMRRVAHPDSVQRDWNNALFHNLKEWSGRRVHRPSKTPFEACWQCVESTGGFYCEGLVMLPEHQHPERAIWCHTPTALVCFTHDLTRGAHGLQGIPFADSAIQHLYYANGIRGPFLFHPSYQVYHVSVPMFLHRRMGSDRLQ